MQVQNGFILLIIGDCVPRDYPVMLSILDLVTCSSWDRPDQVLIKVTVIMFRSSNGDERASRDFFHLIVKAEVTHYVVDIAELATKL